MNASTLWRNGKKLLSFHNILCHKNVDKISHTLGTLQITKKHAYCTHYMSDSHRAGKLIVPPITINAQIFIQPQCNIIHSNRGDHERCFASMSGKCIFFCQVKLTFGSLLTVSTSTTSCGWGTRFNVILFAD